MCLRILASGPHPVKAAPLRDSGPASGQHLLKMANRLVAQPRRGTGRSLCVAALRITNGASAPEIFAGRPRPESLPPQRRGAFPVFWRRACSVIFALGLAIYSVILHPEKKCVSSRRHSGRRAQARAGAGEASGRRRACRVFPAACGVPVQLVQAGQTRRHTAGKECVWLHQASAHG